MANEERNARESLKQYILQRLHDRLVHVLERQPLNIDYLQFICRQELVFISALAEIVHMSEDIMLALTNLSNLIQNLRDMEALEEVSVTIDLESGRGRPRISISTTNLTHLIELGLPAQSIANLLGVSRATLFRRMNENQLSVRALYSTCTDEELDALVTEVKNSMPDAGYRMVRGTLLAQGHRVQWDRVCASMHRVDSVGVFSRMTNLRCISRRRYSVPYPKYLVHIDTNHKLIRYNMVIFGGIDGYSRKIMYLQISDNNRSDTHLAFFREAVSTHGFPQRVRGDHSAENVGIAELMSSVPQTENNSFIAGKSVHNQRIERLWRDVFVGVTSIYHNILHTLEDSHLLDISNSCHLFSCHYVFLPRIQASLDVFSEGWDNHPIRTERNLTPNQLWQVDQFQTPVMDPENVAIPNIEWEESGYLEDPTPGVHVPGLDISLTDDEMAQLKETINPMQYSESYGVDLYLSTVQYVKRLTEIVYPKKVSVKLVVNIFQEEEKLETGYHGTLSESKREAVLLH
ncbi:hypothetical protein UPYG_G00331290 [Umbra pygmaea]|uniref:Integrase core domain-containing protein n=1 Tax=Umbra pygmaea TaxID=75934 RepID=A0ABD0VWI8_UMBPY